METSVARNLIQRVNVGDLLTRSARRMPAAEAIIDRDRRFNYAEFNAMVNRIANGLTSRGYRRGDRLGLASANSAEFLAVYFACAKLGVVCVPINLGWRGDEVTYVLNHAGSRGVVLEADLVDRLLGPVLDSPTVSHIVVVTGNEGHLPDPAGGSDPASGSGPANSEARRVESLEELESVDASEPATFVDERDPVTVLYTSGTTAGPKGVVASHVAVYVESLSMALENHFEPNDRFAALLPMFHTAQLNVHCTPAIAVGAAIHVVRRFDPASLLALIQAERLTQIFCLPMMYRAMLDHGSIANYDLSSLRRATYAMAPMPDTDLQQAIDRFGCEFCLLFGQTEMSPATTIFRPEHQLSHAGAVGTPVVNVEVAIMNGIGDLAVAGEEGEIVYRGPHVMTGYLDNPDATDEAFAGGWFHSGDTGHFDDDGILWFVDRHKDVIKTGGENVASIEVEKAILDACPDVAEVAVVGLTHERWSEAITAFVVPRTGFAILVDDVRHSVRAHLDGYKVPKAVVIVDELPRTSTGKVRKNQLRQHYDQYYA